MLRYGPGYEARSDCDDLGTRLDQTVMRLHNHVVSLVYHFPDLLCGELVDSLLLSK